MGVGGGEGAWDTAGACLTVGGAGEGVVDDGVQGAGPPGGGHGGEPGHQAGEH